MRGERRIGGSGCLEATGAPSEGSAAHHPHTSRTPHTATFIMSIFICSVSVPPSFLCIPQSVHYEPITALLFPPLWWVCQ